mgnify:FL=1|tara:strand:+ start:204 stop:434 length:231 start_codon:yes stop_codon:yes gene_type:complete
MGKSHITTREEVIAKKIIDFLSDIRLDLDMIGLYFGKYARITIWKRLEHIYETAKHHREQEQDTDAHYEYIKNINN